MKIATNNPLVVQEHTGQASKSKADLTVSDKQMDGLIKHLHSNPKENKSDNEKSKVITVKEKQLDKVIKELDKAK